MECTTEQRASVAVSSQRTLANRNRSTSSNVPGWALGKDGCQRARPRIESLLRRTRPISTSATMVLPTGPSRWPHRRSPPGPPRWGLPPRPGYSTRAACGPGTRRCAAPPPARGSAAAAASISAGVSGACPSAAPPPGRWACAAGSRAAGCAPLSLAPRPGSGSSYKIAQLEERLDQLRCRGGGPC